MALQHIDPYPWFLNKTLELVVNEQMVRTRISASEWTDSWRPLLGRLYDRWNGHFPKRYLIAIAGPPGSGKSVLAEELHFMIDKGMLHKEAHTVALPMDGFHYPNAVLATHTRKLPDGTEIPLLDVKGQPDTIDVARLRRYVQALIARPEYVMWPGYSRFVHDVIPDKFKVHQSINLVIVEGNYLLVNRGPFQGLPDLFNLKIYVDAPAPKIMANLMDRHIRGGKSVEQAKEWVKRIDLPNARLAEMFRNQADVVIERDTDDDIAAVTWRGEAPQMSSKTALPETPLPPLAHVPGHGPKSAETHHGVPPPAMPHVVPESPISPPPPPAAPGN